MEQRSKVTAGLPVECPKLYAVVDVVEGRVVARGLPYSSAVGTKRAWEVTDGPAQVIEEGILWPSDDQVLGQLRSIR